MLGARSRRVGAQERDRRRRWWAALLVLVYGAIVGWQVQWLQDRRCPVPSLLDPLSSLQF